tara:strand:- start:497 stop:1729 length:1233 start_codon:yes stop_codon:yes gene_type:complete
MSKEERKKDCRLCNHLTREIVDLGTSPPANNFVDTIDEKVISFPLVVDFCDNCKCIQLRDCLDEEFLYSHYTYMTPDVDSLAKHYDNLINHLKLNLYITEKSKCLEIGSNNGLFLKQLSNKVQSVLGVDPASNIVKIANDSGVETINAFFDPTTSKKIKADKGSMDLVIARHMFAHNSKPEKILLGIKHLLNNEGIIMIENAYAIPTLQNGEFDQIYHEHMFYYTVRNMSNLLSGLGFDLIDVLDSKVHGGSVGFIAAHKGAREINKKVKYYLSKEDDLLLEDKIFKQFDQKIASIKSKVLCELERDYSDKKTVAAYGATAKAFTMFSFLDLDDSKIKYCIDTSSTKIGKFFPIYNIKVVSEEYFRDDPVDTLLVTAWNYKEHIKSKSKTIFSSGTKLIFPLPDFEIFIV